MQNLIQNVKNLVAQIVPAKWFIHIRAWRFQRIGEPESRWLGKLVDPGKAAYDIGANLGIYTCLLKRHAKEVHAWEPNPTLQLGLEATFGDTIHLHKHGLSNQPGTAKLSFPKVDGTVYHGWGSIEHDFAGEDKVFTHDIQLKTLDSQELPTAGFVKIDVEGHELQVLQGAMKTLERDQPWLLVEVEERHAGERCQETLRLLASLGYTPCYLGDNGFAPVAQNDKGDYLLDAGQFQVLFQPQGKPLPTP